MTDDTVKRTNFGFDADFADLSTVRPTGSPVKAKAAPKPKAAKPKAVTKALLMKKRRRVQHAEPVDQLSIRGPVRVLNGFIDYCEAHKLSYWEGMERLVAEVE